MEKRKTIHNIHTRDHFLYPLRFMSSFIVFVPEKCPAGSAFGNVALGRYCRDFNLFPACSPQELIAYGASNLFSSFFSCFVGSTSISRTSVADAAGMKSQVGGLAFRTEGNV